VLTVSSYPTDSPVIGKVCSRISQHPASLASGKRAGATTMTSASHHPSGSVGATPVQPVCAGCHARMDPLGLVENYDAMAGGGRAKANARGRLRPAADGRLLGAAELKTISGGCAKFVRALSDKLLTTLSAADWSLTTGPPSEKIAQRVQQNGCRFPSCRGHRG